jgi:hypothetical protein
VAYFDKKKTTWQEQKRQKGSQRVVKKPKEAKDLPIETSADIRNHALHALRRLEKRATSAFEVFIGCRKPNQKNRNGTCYEAHKELFRELKMHKNREFVDKLRTTLRQLAHETTKPDEPDLTLDGDIDAWFARFDAPKSRASKDSAQKKLSKPNASKKRQAEEDDSDDDVPLGVKHAINVSTVIKQSSDKLKTVPQSNKKHSFHIPIPTQKELS